MKVVLLGTKRKLLPVLQYCRSKNYNIVVIGNPESNFENDTDELTSIAQPYSDELFYDSFPDIIINMKEQKRYLEQETLLNKMFGLPGRYEDPFFWSKEVQHSKCVELKIPTVPNDGDTVLMKTDLSGGTGFKIVDRSSATGFFQNYLDIDYIISCHFYSDGTKWYHLNNHKIQYTDNCPVKSITPYILEEDKELIEDSIAKLSKHLHIHNKLFGWQFLKDVSGNLYSIDFNLRPFGGYDMGSYDTDVSDQNWCDYLFDETPPTHINYHSSIACHYLEAKQFGYSPVKRIKQSIVEMNFEVKKYDSVLVSV